MYLATPEDGANPLASPLRAEDLVGLQNVPLRPLVPGFDEDHVRARHCPFAAYGLLDRDLKDAGARTVQKDPSPTRAWRVVEPRHHAGMLPDQRAMSGKHPVRVRLVI
jgi:hypothetical protein